MDRTAGWYGKLKERIDSALKAFVEGPYRKTLDFALSHRPIVVAVAIATMIVTVGIVAGGHIKFTFMPKVDADNLVAALTLPQGTTVEDAQKAVDQLEASLEQVRAEFDAEPRGRQVGHHARADLHRFPAAFGRRRTRAPARPRPRSAPTWSRSTPSC